MACKDMSVELPPEILQMIFGMCSVSDLLESVRYVSRKWHESVLSPMVWKDKTLQLSGSEDLDELKLLLWQMPFLKNVFLEDVSLQSLSLLCDSCPSLKNLQIHCGDPQVLVSLSSKLTCLTKIDICFQRCFKLEVAFHNSAYSFPPLLRTVIFRMCTTDGSEPLLILNTCHFLEHLVVSLGYDIEGIVKSSLDEKQVSAGRSPGKHNVNTIYLCGAFLRDKDILNVISQCPNLKYLALKHNLYYDNDVLGTIFKEPRTNIVFLDLSYSARLTPYAVISVINACPNLEFLSLMRSFVDDGALLVVINTLHKLQCLNLHGTPITSQYFLTIPQKLPNLTDINLCACRRIDFEVLTELVNLMPKLLIVHPRRGLVKGANATDRHHPFLEQRNFMFH